MTSVLRGSASILGIALLGLIGGNHAVAKPLPENQQQQILSLSKAYQPSLERVAKSIWDYAELGYQETKSSALLQQELKKAGFTIKSGVADMPTGFVASYKRGNGPVIGILAEFDALPGLSQAVEPFQTPHAGHTAGHGCGHNLFGAASTAAAINVAKWMEQNNIQGEVRLYGTPAEEGGGGKVYMTRAGLFNDVDSVIHWHPGSQNSASQSQWLAAINVKFAFKGISAHAAAAPHVGRSALDGVEAMNAMVNMMREHVPQDTRIHYAITNTPKAPNVVPNFSEVFYVVRNPDDATNQAIFQRIIKAAEGAALGTGTTVSHNLVGSFKNMIINDTLGQVMDRNLNIVGGVKLTDAEKAWAEKMRTNMPDGGKGSSMADLENIDAYATDGLIPASSDVGDVSYAAPTVGLSTATYVPGTPAHSWQAVASSGSSIGMKGAGVAAQTMALTAAELMTSPEVLKKAKAEWLERRGADYKYTSLVGDGAPPLNYWKED